MKAIDQKAKGLLKTAVDCLVCIIALMVVLEFVGPWGFLFYEMMEYVGISPTIDTTLPGFAAVAWCFVNRKTYKAVVFGAVLLVLVLFCIVQFMQLVDSEDEPDFLVAILFTMFFKAVCVVLAIISLSRLRRAVTDSRS